MTLSQFSCWTFCWTFHWTPVRLSTRLRLAFACRELRSDLRRRLVWRSLRFEVCTWSVCRRQFHLIKVEQILVRIELGNELALALCRCRRNNPGMITTARHVKSWRPNTSRRLFLFRGPGESLMADSLAQNIPFPLARGMFGAIIGAEFFGSPTICKVSQCSIALPSASIL
jgi:hypothetical protein